MHATNLATRRLPDIAPYQRPVVFVVDDDVAVRESLKPLITLEGWRAEVFGSAKAFLGYPPAKVPNCLVLDTGLPDASGLDVQRLVAHRLEMPVIFIAGYADVPMTVSAMKAGAAEFLTKPIAAGTLLNAIRQALARSEAALERAAEINVLRGRYDSLSHREREVLQLVVSGRLNKQVGAQLGISDITVKAHRGNVMRKMRAGSLVELANIATKLGLAPA